MYKVVLKDGAGQTQQVCAEVETLDEAEIWRDIIACHSANSPHGYTPVIKEFAKKIIKEV